MFSKLLCDNNLILLCSDNKSHIFNSELFSLFSRTYKEYINNEDFENEGSIIKYSLDFNHDTLKIILQYYINDIFIITVKASALIQVLDSCIKYQFVALKNYIKAMIEYDIGQQVLICTIPRLLLSSPQYRYVFLKYMNNHVEFKSIFEKCCEYAINYYFSMKKICNPDKRGKTNYKKMLIDFNAYFVTKQLNDWIIKYHL